MRFTAATPPRLAMKTLRSTYMLTSLFGQRKDRPNLTRLQRKKVTFMEEEPTDAWSISRCGVRHHQPRVHGRRQHPAKVHLRCGPDQPVARAGVERGAGRHQVVRADHGRPRCAD